MQYGQNEDSAGISARSGKREPPPARTKEQCDTDTEGTERILDVFSAREIRFISGRQELNNTEASAQGGFYAEGEFFY